ncbi:MAG: NAD(P)-binding protein [Proteobacteria bacterium]|nr:NAD(P)-binding protein [Pseudomonadota bacterium]
MSREFDAIIVGAGMGGLCVAAYLVAGGKRVAVIEKSPYLGGRCSHRVREDCLVTTGALMIPMGSGSAIRQAFAALNVDMDMIDLTGKMRYRLNHGDYDTSPKGGGLLGMIEFAMQDSVAAAQFHQRIIEAITVWTPLASITILDWFDQHTDSQEVKNLFQGYCAALMGVNMHEIPANEFFNFLKYHSKGSQFGMARLGNAQMMNALASAITASGSLVMTRSPCRKIIIEANSATGVEIKNAEGEVEVLSAPLVLSNAGPRRTIDLSGGADIFEASYIAQFEKDNIDAPIMHASFTLSEPVISDFAGCMVFGNTTNLIYLEIPSAISPHISPQNVYLHTAYGAPADAARPALDQEFENMLHELEANFPGVLDRAHFLVKAKHRGDSPGMHRWVGRGMPVNTSVMGLYNVGDGCAPEGTIGTESAAASAREAARMILG